jgi:hypothetical protein
MDAEALHGRGEMDPPRGALSMRALFEDKSFASQSAVFRINEIGLPTGAGAGAGGIANQRDIWLRTTEDDDFSLYVFKTRAEASAVTIPSTWIARKTGIGLLATPDVPIEISFDEFQGTPDLTGSKAVVTLATSHAPRVGVWAYTSAPDLVICDDIKAELLLRTGAGMALFGFDADRIKVGDPGEARQMPMISIVPAEEEVLESTDTRANWTLLYPITIQIALVRMAGPIAGWRACREYQQAIRSIVCDELRPRFRESFFLIYRSVEGPRPDANGGLLMLANVQVSAQLDAVFRDDIYPR